MAVFFKNLPVERQFPRARKYPLTIIKKGTATQRKTVKSQRNSLSAERVWLATTRITASRRKSSKAGNFFAFTSLPL